MKKWILTAISLGLICALCFTWAISQPDEPIKNLSLKDAEIHSVLSFLADYGKVNIVAAPSVQAKVTLNLNNVTWRQALDIIMKNYSLAGVQEQGYIRVLPLQDYLTEQAALAKHSSEQVSMIGLEMKIIRVYQATASNLVKPIKTVLSERGSVDTDDRTNSIIVRDIPANLERAEQLVKQLDRPVEQIRISAQLLEVDTEALTEFGIKWTVISDQIKGPSVYAESLDVFSNPYAGEDQPYGGKFTFSMIQTDYDLKSVVSALASKGKLKIVAHPEITTVDNTEARIQMGERVPIKQFDNAGNVIITFVDVGTILKVTPHITAENRILMKLQPERSQTKIDPLGVIIQTVNASTNVVVENGQTVVIGGLTTQEEETIKTGIPILKDIPVLGALFSYYRKGVRSKDLVIFVTPTVVEGEMHGSLTPETEVNPPTE
jgi:type IV pilus assembly protein PilQ